MILGVDFTLAALVIIALLIPLYIYRKRIFKRFYPQKNNSVEFVKDIYVYVQSTYPKIRFDFSELKKFSTEKNIQQQQILMCEELAKQFATYEYEFKTQATIPKEHLWSSYHQHSKLQKDNKYPPDWSQRKELAWIRDKKQCNRCGLQLNLSNATALLAKQMRHGGGFNVENIVILCSDCSRIVRSNTPEKVARDSAMLDGLLHKIH